MSTKESLGIGEEYRALYRRTSVEGYEDTAHIFAVDYYKPGSQGKDDFSRKEAWFYYFGDEELKDEFGVRLKNILNDLFIDNTVDWDIMTLAPSQKKDGLNSNMLSICKEVSKDLDIDYRQVLRRSRNVDETHELQSSRGMIASLQNSIEVDGDVEGLNIIVIDNVSIYGFKLSHLTKVLLEAGARRVFCVCLGVTNHERGVEDLEKGVTASLAVKKFGEEQ